MNQTSTPTFNSSLKPDEDYLDEDKPLKFAVKKQNFCIISMLTPNAFPEHAREQYKDQNILGIKVRGVFETYESAKVYADRLQKQDKFHNIFVGEVGKWLPFNVDISKMETEDDPVYREQSLNQYMKAYKDSLKEEEINEKERKEATLKASNAKVVTGESGAPDYTGIGCPEITPPGIVPSSYNSVSNTGTNTSTSANANTSTNTSDNNLDVNEIHSNSSNKISSLKTNDIDEQMNSAEQQRVKLEQELETSRNNLADLDMKLSVINDLYKELKK